MAEVAVVLGVFSILLKLVAKIDRTDVKGTMQCQKIVEIAFLITGCIALF